MHQNSFSEMHPNSLPESISDFTKACQLNLWQWNMCHFKCAMKSFDGEFSPSTQKNEINPKKYPPGWISSSAPESGCNIWTSILGLRMYCIQLKKKQTAGDFLRMVNQQQRWRQVTQFLRCFPQRHRFNESSGANTILFFKKQVGSRRQLGSAGKWMGFLFAAVSNVIQCFQCHPGDSQCLLLWPQYFIPNCNCQDIRRSTFGRFFSFKLRQYHQHQYQQHYHNLMRWKLAVAIVGEFDELSPQDRGS